MRTYHLTTRACALRQNSLAKFLLQVAGKDCDTICQMEFNYELNRVNIEEQVQHARWPSGTDIRMERWLAARAIYVRMRSWSKQV